MRLSFCNCTEVEQSAQVNQHLFSFNLLATSSGHLLLQGRQFSCHLWLIHHQHRLCLRQERALLKFHVH
jgi:hypothetical protein